MGGGSSAKKEAKINAESQRLANESAERSAAAQAAAAIEAAKINSQAAREAGAAGNLQQEKAIWQQQNSLQHAGEFLGRYVQSGTQALGAYNSLLGLNGAADQGQAIANLQNMPGFQEQIKYGENALLQNASATGGLRGGNSQTALAQFRPMLLNQAIQQQIGNLSTANQQGYNAAASMANAHLGTGNNISNIYNQMGELSANSILSAGNSWANAAMAQGVKPVLNYQPTSSGKSGGGVGSIAGGALGGAATGAAIGSVVPGIGTAIGAGVGAVAGGLSGSSK